MATVKSRHRLRTGGGDCPEYNCICEPEEKVDVIEELLREDEDPEDSLVPNSGSLCDGSCRSR